MYQFWRFLNLGKTVVTRKSCIVDHYVLLYSYELYNQEPDKVAILGSVPLHIHKFKNRAGVQ